ncbi:chromosome segregation protein SMC [Malacoplasma penetrans]|uniref:AAA family ATPase n=1 Tax=Malacoplasma penetrans TaxID=28227 RepID=UPI001011C0E5|nr:AAA family ATPase [Malacoplasma penetrans]RXY97270.1 chromosome segregation protein SMC [Malacoplasma penetrans]
MIFLKKFEAIGFKSFADFTKLNFDSTMIGIVGPNGAGKSNVIDAIKWVLGEQSIKSLRGKKSDDIIFHGSKSKEACEYAQVTLTFDNTKKQLHFDGDEVSVSRKLHRGNGNNEYYINGQLTRLKDIHDIFSDTGLSKGSLGIISQGTVNWFADSKPEERRTIFEEAAGISKYIRKKEESLRQLERTQNNLNRVNDLTKELYKDIKKLEVQASKAKEYSEKKEELTKLEISILVKDIVQAKSDLETVQTKLNNSKNIKQEVGPKLEMLSNQLNAHKEMLTKAEINNDKFSWELGSIKDKIKELELQKVTFENDLAIDMNSSDFESRINAIETSIIVKEKELSTVNSILERNKSEVSEFTEKLDNLKYESKLLEKEILDLSKTVTKQESDLEHLSVLLKSKPNFGGGAKAILDNKQALTGVLGSVLDFVKCDPIHEKAITTALGKNSQNIVVNTSRDVKRAIDFLINNTAGVATFMPVYDMNPKPMRDEHHQILLQLDGFIGIASELIKCDKKIKPVFDVLLNKVIIANNFEQALEISKYTYQLYKIVTLDGQIINPHGVITGGYTKHLSDSLVSVDKKIKAIEKEIEENKKTLATKENRKAEVELQIIDLDSKVRERKINLGIYFSSEKTLSEEIVKLKTEYQKSTKKNFGDSEANLAKDIKEITDRLNSLNNSKEKVTYELNTNENTKRELKKAINDLETNIDQNRKLLNESTDVIVELTETEVRSKSVLEVSKQKLNDTYKMTIENAIEKYSQPLEISDQAARNRIERLSKEIGYIGPINMDAVNELKEKSERYEKMRNEEIEITQAKENILDTIKELDQKAHEDFERTIIQINEELPKTFKYLFGGGSCSINFTDPTDILTSGIDIRANPPGKHVNSLFALSGGEKTLVALSVLFSILKVSSFPLVVLDEAESALDPSNVERFGDIISAYSNETQFIVITHREGTMLRCDKLYGATMQQQGVTIMFQSKVQEAKKYASDDQE